jgi:hypothetical protein
MLVSPIDEAPPVLDAAAHMASPDRTLVSLLLHRALALLPHAGADDARPDSPPAMSPRSSSDSDTILPLSAPPGKTAFGDVLSEKALAAPRARFRLPASPSVSGATLRAFRPSR